MRVGLAQMPDIQRLTKKEIGAQKNPPTEITARGLERNFYLLFIISQFIKVFLLIAFLTFSNLIIALFGSRLIKSNKF